MSMAKPPVACEPVPVAVIYHWQEDGTAVHEKLYSENGIAELRERLATAEAERDRERRGYKVTVDDLEAALADAAALRERLAAAETAPTERKEP